MVGQYKRISLLLAMILIFTVWLPALAAENAASAAGGAVMTREELNRPGRKVGVSTGSASMLIVEKELPEAEIVYFEDNVSAYEAVAQGKIDAYIFARWQMQLTIDSGLRASTCWRRTWMKKCALPQAFLRSQRSRISAAG